MSAATLTTRASIIGLITIMFGITLPLPVMGDMNESEASIRQKLREEWLQKITAPPTSMDPHGVEKQIAIPTQQKQLALSEIKQWGEKSYQALLLPGSGMNWWGGTYAASAPSLLYGSYQVNEAGYYGWPYLAESNTETPVFAELPGWFVDAVEQEVKKLSIAAVRQQKQTVTQKAGEGNTIGRWKSYYGPGEAFVWAGPAVKDGVASYNTKDDVTTVRISMPSEGVAAIYFWAQRYGWPLQSRLLRSKEPIYPHSPIIIVGSTSIPVWLVNADGLIAAKLTSFSTGGSSCDGSQWVEFTLKGTATPPVWAVLGFSDATRANGVTVRRLPKQKTPAGQSYLEAQRSEIELRWPNESLPPLRIAARRFEWVESKYETTPDSNVKEISREVLNSAWCTQVFTKPNELASANYGTDLLLSSAGSPLCAPQ